MAWRTRNKQVEEDSAGRGSREGRGKSGYVLDVQCDQQYGVGQIVQRTATSDLPTSLVSLEDKGVGR
jgi:hypothetical protein